MQDVFLAALEVEGPERSALLDERCADDPELRREVESLLDAERNSDSVERLADSWLSPLANEPEPPSLEGRQVGPFRVGIEVGRGGMSRVYRAERNDDQFQQTVAVKVLYRTHGELARRFLLERRVLARLEHPGIARLIDGGDLPDGSPYLVMEYVDGERIDRWADRPGTGPRRIVELFVQVCEAVQYAHNNLVVHRDLKPGNILVTAADQPRLLDFGVAKLLGDDDPELTRPFASILTPEYASPEQIRGEPVTTATDVHALGLILYRLLSGASPRSVRGKSDAGIRQMILSEGELAPSGGAENPGRARELRGDLDNIVARATAAESARRYPSPGALAEDLRRWMDGQPVLARPASRRYRMRKFVRRHRASVIAAALAVVLLLGGSAGVGWQARIAARERDIARQAAAQSAEVTRYLVRLFAAADPVLAGGETLTARQMLDRGRDDLPGKLRTAPRARAALVQAMGEAYLNLGFLDVADTLLREADSLTCAITPVDSLAVAAASESLGRLDEASGRLPEAAVRFEAVLDLRRRRLEPDDPLIATAWNNLGSVMVALTRYDSATTCLQRAIEIRRRENGDPADLAVVESNLAATLGRLERWDEASAKFAAADSVLRSAGMEDSPQRAKVLGNWGVMLLRARALDRSRELLEANTALWRRIGGEDHPEVGIAENNLASVLEKLGLGEEAEPHYRESLRIKQLALGPDHPSTAHTLNNLATFLRRRGDAAEAEPLLRRSAAIRESTLPADHPGLARGWYNLALALNDLGQRAEAESLFRRALELLERVRGAEYRSTRATASALAGLLEETGRTAAADSLVRKYGLEQDGGS